MKKTIICAAIVLANFFEAQTTDSNKNIPNIIPPSPTVNSLMKFEEVPVSNYTGIPDITIPLTSLSTGISSVPINLSLKYHVSNAKSDAKASEVGLGWSIMAGGTISRTIMGGPDDQIIKYSLGGNDKIGIYFDENTSQNVLKNYFPFVMNNLPVPAAQFNYSKAVFEEIYQNRYDSKYDLYQYNFLNYTGRFIVKKVGNSLNVVKLDRNNLKIDVNYTTDYEVTSFVVTDDSGNKYSFDVLEKSKLLTMSESTGVAMDLYSSNTAMNKKYNSAFHLSSIKNNNNSIIASFLYDDPVTIQSSETRTDTNIYQTTVYVNHISVSQNLARLPRTSSLSISTTVSDIRKLQEINIPGRGKINFEYEYGREDSNYTGGENATKLSKLKTIKVSNTDGKLDQKFNLQYSYKQSGTYKRLFLESVEKLNSVNSNYQLEHNYVLKYYEGLVGLIAENDSFFKCSSNSSDPTLCSTTELLRSVVYPTKGMVNFNYETSTYSYQPQGDSGTAEITNFDDNPLNWDPASALTTFNNFTGGEKYAFTLSDQSEVKFIINTPQINQYAWQMIVLKKEGSNYIQKGGTGPAASSNNIPPSEYTVSLQPGEYYLKLICATPGTSGLSFNASFAANYRIRNANNYKFLHDFRNIRIKTIDYFDKANFNSLGAPVGSPVRTVNYNYSMPDNIKKSSGALVFSKPLKSYLDPYRAALEYELDGGVILLEEFRNDIIRQTDKNFLPVQKTKGGDIGYQYVSVSELDKGKTIYQYTSPIDNPNSLNMPLYPPFIPVPNHDFQRGNLINKKVFNNTGVILTEDKYQYDYPVSEVMTGVTISEIQHPEVGINLYGGKYSFIEQFLADTQGVRAVVGTDIFSFLRVDFDTELLGTANLISEEHIEYYPSQQSVSQVTNNTYNTRDYLIKKSMSSPDNSITESTYQYAHEKNNTRLINANMIGIPLETSVLKKQNAAETGKTISRTETRYDNAANLFPSSVVSYDLQNTASTEITYNQYDSKGNLQQYTTKDGIPTAIVWGYNQTQPIAKIVGATYTQVSNLAAAIISASDLDASDSSNEAALITALDNFRKDSTMANYQISTYTYDPLIGVTSITPPSGIREAYFYDSAGRLKEVREGSQTGKLLKEFKYNYKN